MKLIYIAGPYRGPNAWAIEENIRRAEALALAVWRLGAAAICPHTNTRHFHGTCCEDVFLTGCLEMVKRCDGLLMVPGWEASEGATEERRCALNLNLPVFDSLHDLERWLAHTDPRPHHNGCTS